MSTKSPFIPRCQFTAIALAMAALVAFPAALQAQKRKNNPASKVYISDVAGEAVIDTGDAIEDVAKRSVYNAQGTVIETKKASDDTDRRRAYSTMVYSNGTGAFFDADTRVEVRRFEQEPFVPNRSDIDLEPSISQTQAFVARGSVGLCTAKLVAGSSMTYQTQHGSVNIRGRKVVIEANRNETKISMLEGESTVRAGVTDMGGHTVHAGEQAVIRQGANGAPNTIEIQRIPPNEAPQLDEKVTMACNAKKTVYFDVKEKPTTEGRKSDASASSGGNGNSDGGTTPSGPIDAFTDPGSTTTPVREIVPVEIVPVTSPVDVIMSTARAVEPPKPGG